MTRFALAMTLGLAACAPTSPTAERPAYAHRFDDAARWAREFDDPSRDAWQLPERVLRALALAPGMRVADIGAGTGYFEPHLSRAVGPSGAVLALDVEPDMVRYLRDRAAREQLTNVEGKLVAPDDPGLGPASVDRVLIVDTWHHLSGRATYAARLRAALRPAGLVAVVDFTREAEHGPPPQHRIPPEEVVAELTAAGLEARILDAGLPQQYVVVGALPAAR